MSRQYGNFKHVEPSHYGAITPLGPAIPNRGLNRLDWIPSWPQEASKQMIVQRGQSNEPAVYDGHVPIGASQRNDPTWQQILN